MISLLAFVVFAPFLLAQGRRDWLRQMQPHEQALTRASHGVGLAAVGGFLLWFMTPHGFAGAARSLWANPSGSLMWIPVAVIACSLAWAVIVGSQVAGLRNPPLMWRALVKLAAGIAAAVFLRRDDVARAFGPEFWQAQALLILQAVAVWCIGTGAARLLLLSWPRRSAYGLVTINIAANAFRWNNAPRRRPWWKFW